jgi:hypothetical protein
MAEHLRFGFTNSLLGSVDVNSGQQIKRFVLWVEAQ